MFWVVAPLSFFPRSCSPLSPSTLLQQLRRRLHVRPSSPVASFLAVPSLGADSETWEPSRRNQKQKKGQRGSKSLCSRDFGGPWLVRGARLASSGVSALLEGGQEHRKEGAWTTSPSLFSFLAPFFCRPPPPSVILISSSLLLFFFCFLFETGRTSLVQRPPAYTSPDRDRHLDNHNSLVVADCDGEAHHYYYTKISHARSNARHACTSRDGSKNKHCKLKASPTQPDMSPYPRPQSECKAFLNKS